MTNATYPSWRYHATLPPRLIQSPDEEQVGWSDTPTAGREPFVDPKVAGPMQWTAAPQPDAPDSGPGEVSPAPARTRKKAAKRTK